MQITRLVVAASHLKAIYLNYGLAYLRVEGQAPEPPGQPETEQLVSFVEQASAQGECVLIYSGTVDAAAVRVLAAYLGGSFKWQPDYIISFLRVKLKPELAEASRLWTARLQCLKEQPAQKRELDRLTLANTLANMTIEQPSPSRSQKRKKPAKRLQWLDLVQSTQQKAYRRPITASLLRGKVQ